MILLFKHLIPRSNLVTPGARQPLLFCVFCLFSIVNRIYRYTEMCYLTLFGIGMNLLVAWEELKDEPLETLLEFAALGEGDEWAEAACINLIFAFRGRLLAACTVMCQKVGLTETDAEEVANRVFERFRKYPTGYDSAHPASKDIEKGFLLYLFGIARRELYDYIHPDISPYDGTERVITALIDPEGNYEPERRAQLVAAERALDEIFSDLTPKHKIIYLTYRFHEKEGRYLPKRLRAELRELLGGIAKSTIRVYKKEAFELVQKKLGHAKV